MYTKTTMQPHLPRVFVTWWKVALLSVPIMVGTIMLLYLLFTWNQTKPHISILLALASLLLFLLPVPFMRKFLDQPAVHSADNKEGLLSHQEVAFSGPDPLPDHTSSVPLLPRSLKYSPSQSTACLLVSTGLDVGLTRRGRPNEDSLLAWQHIHFLHGSFCPVGLFVIADGIGGLGNGQLASTLVMQTLNETVIPSIISDTASESYPAFLAGGIHEANLAIYQRNCQNQTSMGTTIAAALIIGSTAYIASAGDSRVYLYDSEKGLRQVTRDHSMVAFLVENNLIYPEDIYTHPRRNEIYRSLGRQANEELDTFSLTLHSGNILLLCSDGLWEMVRDPQIQQILETTQSRPEQISAALIQAALDGGGKDNISVITVCIP